MNNFKRLIKYLRMIVMAAPEISVIVFNIQINLPKNSKGAETAIPWPCIIGTYLCT